jgi:hypothetical protein
MYWFTSSTCPTHPCTLSRLADPSPPEPFRADLVERVRREIAEGVYETQDKWEAALDRLLDRLEQT